MRPAIPLTCVLALIGASASASLAPAAAYAQAGDPAAQQVQRFDDVLLSTMKQGKALGFQGRYRKFEPAVRQAFDLPIMIRFAVGPSWTTMSAADQAALLAAFTRFNVSTWANHFDSYEGQHFDLGPVDTRGAAKLVHTKLVAPGGASNDLTYRMAQTNTGQWKIIDVYFEGSISQLSQQRSDYASTLQAGGASALVKKINALSDKLAAG